MTRVTAALTALSLLFLLIPAAMAEANAFDYRFADAKEAAELLLSDRDYYENLSQNDLNFRMQKPDATLEELEAFVAEQTRDFSDREKSRVDRSMALIRKTCAERGYALSPLDTIVFAKTTMAEECNAAAYTHGTQIYLNESVLHDASSNKPGAQKELNYLVAHELFHCLTRYDPEFRASMYGILGFIVMDSDFVFPRNIRDIMISNPDVEHHDSYAAFDIDGKMTDCAVLFSTRRPFEHPGDSFWDDRQTVLVPIDDLSTMYTFEDAANFWNVFGKNTRYVIDPEEALADNFSYTIVRGLDGINYPTPEIIRSIDALLKLGFGVEKAA